LIAQLEDLLPASKKDIIAIGDNIPDIRKDVILLRKKLFQGRVYQFAVLVRRKIAEIVLAASIDPIILPDGDIPDHRLIGKGIVFPVGAVKTQQTVIIGKIDHPILVLDDAPVLCPCIIDVLRVIYDVRDAYCILTKGPEDNQEKKNCQTRIPG